MKNLKFVFLTVLLFVCSNLTLNLQAQAQDGDWGPSFTIKPDATPIEIIGGNVITGWDTYILLVTVPSNTLEVYNINEADPNVVTTSSIPINGPAFGFAHTIVNLNKTNFFGGQGTSVTAIVDNSFLQSLTTNDGINWQKVNITNNPVYGSAEVAVDPLNPGVAYAGGCNTVNNSYDIFESFDGGQTWVIVINILGEGGPIKCAIDNATRCTFDVFDGQPAVFCGQLVNNTLQQFINRGFGNEVIGTDIYPSTVPSRAANRLKISENNSPLPQDRTFFNYTYFHEQTNTVKNASFIMRGQQQQQRSPIKLQSLGAAALDLVFSRIAMAEGPPGTANVVYPGRHFQLLPNNQVLTFDSFQGVEIIDLTDSEFPLFEVLDGPVGATPGEFRQNQNDDFLDPRKYRFTIGFRFSFDYAEFHGTIPVTPIPALSEWGLIAMAGVLGIIGLLAIRRRKVTA